MKRAGEDTPSSRETRETPGDRPNQENPSGPNDRGSRDESNRTERRDPGIGAGAPSQNFRLEPNHLHGQTLEELANTDRSNAQLRSNAEAWERKLRAVL